MLRVICCLLSVGSVVDAAGGEASTLAIDMTTRYAPYADWATVVDVNVLARQSPSRSLTSGGESARETL